MLKAKAAAEEREEDKRPFSEQIRSAVCPLAHLTYEQQLEKKTREIEDILAQVRTGIADEYKFLKGTSKSDNDVKVHFCELIKKLLLASGLSIE